LYRRLTECRFLSTFLPVIAGPFVYARHASDCPKRSDRFWRRCHCIKWIRGVVDDKPVRMSAGTRSWERAEAKAREMEQRGVRKRVRVSINEAVKAYLKDEQGRMLADNSTAQSRTLFEKQFVPWTETEGFKYVDELTVPVLSNFRAALNQSTGNNANTARRKRMPRAIWKFVNVEGQLGVEFLPDMAYTCVYAKAKGAVHAAQGENFHE